MKKYAMVVPGIVLAMGLAACGEDNDMEDATVTPDVEEDESVGESKIEDELTSNVDLISNDGKSVGTAELIEQENGVLVKLNGMALPPGTHGIHFHETGTCEAPDFESAGGHFNPNDDSHGLKHEEGPHAGDLPNIEVNEDGTVATEFLAALVTLKNGEPNSLMQEGGTSLIIHAGEDDGTSQPSGDSGDRIACGEIN